LHHPSIRQSQSIVNSRVENRRTALPIFPTLNVSEYGTECRVRANFQIKVMNNKGNVMDIKQIEDDKFYQDFFAKGDKGIFIQKEKL
jgi:hypothetical protein